MGPIGVFDSGYGGLTILKEITVKLPEYDYLYLGDNARAPYGPRSFETIYQYTLQCVKWFFTQGCPLVILACNTASAKALRNIQQIVGQFTQTNRVGVLGTKGTIQSLSYPIEINKISPAIKVFQQACPMWVPLVENNEYNSEGADYFVQKYLQEILLQSPEIDTLLLACTHYPLLIDKIKEFAPKNITILSQGEIVANSLVDYLARHPEIELKCTKNNESLFFTTDATESFDEKASIFYGQAIKSTHLILR